MFTPKIIDSKDWNPNDIEQPHLRATLALEHLINNNFPDKTSVRFIEVGPTCVIDMLKPRHIAPISELYKRNFSLKCIAYGCEKPASEEENKKTLGTVEMIQGLLTTDNFSDDQIDLLYERLGGRPNIIFGQHIFENSSSSIRSLPFGPYKPFEKASEILERGGFIVVDNYGGSSESVGKQDNWKYTKQMRYESSYQYARGKSIQVFKKI